MEVVCQDLITANRKVLSWGRIYVPLNHWSKQSSGFGYFILGIFKNMFLEHTDKKLKITISGEASPNVSDWRDRHLVPIVRIGGRPTKLGTAYH